MIGLIGRIDQCYSTPIAHLPDRADFKKDNSLPPGGKGFNKQKELTKLAGGEVNICAGKCTDLWCF